MIKMLYNTRLNLCDSSMLIEFISGVRFGILMSIVSHAHVFNLLIIYLNVSMYQKNIFIEK